MPTPNGILDKLNAAQREAVCYQGGPLLILAGAGSGKTRALTARVLFLLEQGVAPESILAVTFTNRAAAEMRQRVRAGGSQGGLVSVGTFHSICLQILRKEGALIGLPSEFTIYDDQDQLSVIKECMKELKLEERQIAPKRIRERISRAKDDFKEIAELEAMAVEYEDDLFLAVYKKYEQKLTHYKACDFGDLLVKVARLFLKFPEVLAVYRDKFRHILVDEYQDTNYTQYIFINLLAKKHRNLTVVGDPDQSIYEWRGANIQNILSFENDYEEAKVIRLEQNYRSTNTILKAANAVIAHNLQRKPKNLWSENGDGDLIDLYRAYNEREEARFVVNRLLYYQDEGYTLQEMVCFYRVHAQSRVLEEELRRANIPYRIVGGVQFYARKEIKDLLAYLRVIQNPGDTVSLKRILNVPKRGIGDSTVEKIHACELEKKTPSFFAAIDQYLSQTKSGSKAAKALSAFSLMMRDFHALKSKVSLSQLAVRIVESSGYARELERENTIEAKSRLENVQELLDSIREFEEMLPPEQAEDALRHYLEFISLQTSLDTWDGTQQYFTLMTLHSAKGLEFPIVVMVGLEEGLLPHTNAMSASTKEIEEERRLCYVGMTRAKEKLILTHALFRKTYAQNYHTEASRFLKEIPSQYFNRYYDENETTPAVSDEPFYKPLDDREPYDPFSF